MTRAELEAKAEQTLQETDCYRVPVPIGVVAQRLGLATEAVVLKEDTSGMLVVEGNVGAIGYNASHAPVRQRFTIAHEIAHYVLHAKKKNQRSRVFIDRYVTFRRDEKSAKGDDREEVEANQFGAALLAPRILVQQEIQKHELDLDDDDDIVFLAKRFQMSPAAMTNRLANLRLVRQ
jgi:Zn-dependent peptidase ImmA (M78 family)